MRCITAEERDLLLDAARPDPGYVEDPDDLEDMSDREVVLLDSLVRRGNARSEVRVCGNERYCKILTITPRGRLAIACYDATNVRAFA